MKRMVMALALLSGCRHGPPAPVELEPADVCAHCRMAISEARYAAEWIEADGTAHKFDDIGCMVRFRPENRAGPPAALFVHDYDGGGWLKAAEAWYVRSPGIPSPMASGIIALRDRAAAARHGEKHGVPVRRFEEFWGK